MLTLLRRWWHLRPYRRTERQAARAMRESARCYDASWASGCQEWARQRLEQAEEQYSTARSAREEAEREL